jgi:hypothetical protein
VPGNVEKREAPTLLRERLDIGLDENLDGLFAGVNLYANRRVAKVNLAASSVLVELWRGASSSRFSGVGSTNQSIN